MLKTKNIVGFYSVESIIKPRFADYVFLRDKRLGQAISCYDQSGKSHASIFEEYGKRGGLGLPITHVIKCTECGCVYDVPEEVVEVWPFFPF